MGGVYMDPRMKAHYQGDIAAAVIRQTKAGEETARRIIQGQEPTIRLRVTGIPDLRQQRKRGA
jgi:demethoxyubiquinone hydroxylase (CLK1/Coq7/Cat5 family)